MADVTFTPEQQQELNRIVARETGKAETKGEARAAAKYESVTPEWLGLIADYTADSDKVTRRLMDYHGITAGTAASGTDDGDGAGQDDSDTVKALRKELADGAKERGEMKRMLGSVFKDKATGTITKSMKDDGWTQEEVDKGLERAAALRRTRTNLSLEDAFELSNKKEIRETISRNLRKELDGDDYEDTEPADNGAGGYDTSSAGTDETPEPPPPVKLGNENRGGRTRKKKENAVPDELKSTIGTLFKDEADFAKWDGVAEQT